MRNLNSLEVGVISGGEGEEEAVSFIQSLANSNIYMAVGVAVVGYIAYDYYQGGFVSSYIQGLLKSN